MSALKIDVIVLLVSLMFGTGIQLKREAVKAAFSNLSLLGRVLVANVIFVPLFGVLVVRAFNLDEFIGVGILLMAIAPGVPVVAYSAGKTAGGSRGLAAALGLILPTVAAITVPLTARFVLPAGTGDEVRLGPTIVTLVLFQIAPLLTGVLIAERLPKTAAKLEKPLIALFGLALVGVLVILGPVIVKSLATVYGSFGLFTALLISVFAIAVGWLMGGPDPECRHTSAVATNLRNIGVASFIATQDFPGTAAGAMVIAYFIVQIVVSVVAGRIFVHRLKVQPMPVSGQST